MKDKTVRSFFFITLSLEKIRVNLQFAYSFKGEIDMKILRTFFI